MEREKREFPRLDLTLKVFYHVEKPLSAIIIIGDEEIEATMLNLSQGGVALLTKRDIPKDTILNIKFVLPDISKVARFSLHGPLTILGEVVYNITLPNNQHRLGINFIKIEPKDKTTLINFINTLLSQGPII